MIVTIDFSKCRLHKETEKGIIITGSKPVYNKNGSFGTDSCFLAFSVIEIVSRPEKAGGEIGELIIKLPKWLFKKQIEGKKDIVDRIKIINLEEEE